MFKDVSKEINIITTRANLLYGEIQENHNLRVTAHQGVILQNYSLLPRPPGFSVIVSSSSHCRQHVKEIHEWRRRLKIKKDTRRSNATALVQVAEQHQRDC